MVLYDTINRFYSTHFLFRLRLLFQLKSSTLVDGITSAYEIYRWRISVTSFVGRFSMFGVDCTSQQCGMQQLTEGTAECRVLVFSFATGSVTCDACILSWRNSKNTRQGPRVGKCTISRFLRFSCETWYGWHSRLLNPICWFYCCSVIRRGFWTERDPLSHTSRPTFMPSRTPSLVLISRCWSGLAQ